jgi:hypothetical protein
MTGERNYLRRGQLIYRQDVDGLDGDYTTDARELTLTMWGYNPENQEHAKQVSHKLYDFPLDRKLPYVNRPQGRISRFIFTQQRIKNKYSPPPKSKSERMKELSKRKIG